MSTFIEFRDAVNWGEVVEQCWQIENNVDSNK
jgi:hypothetical protein